MLRAALVLLALCLGTPAVAQSGAGGAPAWGQLTADQQMILAPLKEDWPNIEPERRRKWIGLAKRYPKMTPQQQERVQKRMQRWASLTPEQRQRARENYQRLAKQRAQKREELRRRWAEYQALPPDERARVAPPPGRPPKTAK